MSRSFSYLQVEAALCIWEHVDLCSIDSKRPEDTALKKYRKAHGTVALRHDCIRLADYCLAVYDRLPEDAKHGSPYDWEIIPAILEHIDWTTNPSPTAPRFWSPPSSRDRPSFDSGKVCDGALFDLAARNQLELF